jgi:hypothetical protein
VCVKSKRNTGCKGKEEMAEGIWRAQSKIKQINQKMESTSVTIYLFSVGSSKRLDRLAILLLTCLFVKLHML